MRNFCIMGLLDAEGGECARGAAPCSIAASGRGGVITRIGAMRETDTAPYPLDLPALPQSVRCFAAASLGHLRLGSWNTRSWEADGADKSDQLAGSVLISTPHI
jgi:hypothetical protein